MKVALPYLYQGKISGQGVFEEVFAERLKKMGAEVEVFYPSNKDLRKIEKIGTVLTMASLREHKTELEKCDVIYSTNGTCVGLLDLKTPVVAAYHSTGFTIDQDIVKNEKEMSEFGLYEKFKKKLEQIALIPEAITSRSIEAWGLCGKFTAQNVKNIIAVSNNVKQELIDNAGAIADNITVIENGIEDYWFKEEDCPECKKISKRWQGKPVVVWMGRMGRDLMNFKIKGIDRVLEVMDQIDSTKAHKVVIAIVPDEKSWHKQKFGELFKKRGIEFIPNFPYEHLPHLMQNTDIFLMPSRYEGFSLSLIEAMASDCVPISYSIGVAPEAVEDKKNGFIVTNVSEMIEKTNLLIDDKTLRERLSKAAKNTAQEHYRIRPMMEKYLEIFQKATN